MTAVEPGSAGTTTREDPVRSIADPKERVARAKARFDAVVLDHAPQDDAVDLLDEVRLAGHGRLPGAPTGGAVLVAPHGVGKTMTIEKLRRRANDAASVLEGRIPVLHVDLSVAGTTESVATSILTALGRPRPDLGRETVRWSKAVAGLRQFGVELTIFDEFNRAARRPTMSRPIAGAIRERIVDAGICPIAVVGSEEAGQVLRSAPELMERLDEQIDLEPLDWIHAGDRRQFVDFVTRLDQALIDGGLTTERSGFGGIRIAEALCEASGGRVRRVMKIVRSAMAQAIRRGETCVTRADLENAVDEYAVSRGFVDHNPFSRRS